MLTRRSLRDHAMTHGETTAVPAQERLLFEGFSAPEGLSQSIVECILLDRRGFLWCGTEDGLNRFDGYEFKVFRHSTDDPESLSYSEVKCLAESRDGALWVGTFEGLNRFDPELDTCRRFLHRPEDPRSLSNDVVRALVEDHRGTLWVGTQGGGLDRLEIANGGFRHHRHEPHDPQSLADDDVRALCEDDRGRLWVGTAAGLDCRQHGGAGFRHYRHDPGDDESLSPGGVTAIFQDRRRRLWIGTRGGLAHLDPASGRCRRYSAASGHLAGDHVTCLCEDDDGQLIVGTDGGGLTVLDPESGTARHYRHHPQDPSSVGTDRIFSCCRDGSGQLWVGTYGAGLVKADPRRARFRHFSYHPDDPGSLCHGIVWSMWEDRAGILWVGTDGGLDRIDRRRGEITHFLADPENPRGLVHPGVRVVYEGPSGTLWVGTNGGLQRLDRDTGAFERFVHDPRDPASLSHNEIRSLYEDAAGVLWIGTLGGGLDRFDPHHGTFTTFRHDPDDPRSLCSDFIRPIFEDRRGELWIGTQGGGLDRFDRDTGHCRHYRHDPGDPHSLSSDHVFSIWEDEDGLLWLGTYAGGLDRFDPRTGRVRRYGEADGLPANLIYGLLGDDDGKLWISSNKGLTRFDFGSQRFHTYDWRDGLQADEFNGGSYHRSAGGELFFGGVNGFNAFWPADLEDSRFEPSVVLTDFQLSGRSLAAGEALDGGRVPLARSLASANKIRLAYDDRVFSFQFAALDFTNPLKNRYAFRMWGFDRTWQTTGAGRRFATYTNLPPGRYRFEVRGTNCDGIWSPHTAAITIEIAPPIWGTWWFRALATTLAAGIAARSYRRRVRTIRLETELAAAQEAQRSIWPQGDPHLPGFEIAAVSLPASEVGGDFFDYVWHDAQRRELCIAIGDVAGKGMRAAMTAALSSGMLAAKIEAGSSLEEVLKSVNRLAYRRAGRTRRTARKFTAVCLARVSSASDELRYVNAAMAEPLLKSGDRVRFLSTPDPRLPLGVQEEVAYREERVKLGPGDVLVLYTDGIPEAQNAIGELYGYEALRQRLAVLPESQMSSRGILRALLADVGDFTDGCCPQLDDMTMVVIKVEAA